MSLNWPNKDPDERLDYVVNWAAALDADFDVIVDSEWLVPPGITNVAESFNDTKTTIWLSGGTIDDQLEITNRITTAAGRIFDQSVRLKIKAK